MKNKVHFFQLVTPLRVGDVALQQRENIKKIEKEVIELKDTITKLKNKPQGFNSRLMKQRKRLVNLITGQRISYSQRSKKKKRMRKCEDSLRDLLDNIQ